MLVSVFLEFRLGGVEQFCHFLDVDVLCFLLEDGGRKVRYTLDLSLRHNKVNGILDLGQIIKLEEEPVDLVQNLMAMRVKLNFVIRILNQLDVVLGMPDQGRLVVVVGDVGMEVIGE